MVVLEAQTNVKRLVVVVVVVFKIANSAFWTNLSQRKPAKLPDSDVAIYCNRADIRSWLIDMHRFNGTLNCFIYLFIYLFFIYLFRAARMAYRSSQARGRIGAVAAGLHHSHSNARYEPFLGPTPQLTATLNP